MEHDKIFWDKSDFVFQITVFAYEFTFFVLFSAFCTVLYGEISSFFYYWNEKNIIYFEINS